MADEARYSDEIRIPISFTLPWSGRFTPNGHPWPIDAKGREWPSDNRGDPEFPIDLLPKGFAPGTNSVYAEEDGRRVVRQRRLRLPGPLNQRCRTKRRSTKVLLVPHATEPSVSHKMPIVI